jgi:hypothetical protein
MTTAYTGTEQGTAPGPRNHALDDLRRAVVGAQPPPPGPAREQGGGAGGGDNRPWLRRAEALLAELESAGPA